MTWPGWARVAVWVVLGGCGGVVSGGPVTGSGADAASPTGPEAAAPSGGDAQAPEGGTVVGECTTQADCAVNATCVFAIGSCSAKGLCYENDSNGCGSRQYLCGCNGVTVTAGCGTFGGATGPTTGAPSKTDEGVEDDGPDYCPEGGTGTTQDAAVAPAPDAAACAACDATCEGDPNCIMDCGCSPDAGACAACDATCSGDPLCIMNCGC